MVHGSTKETGAQAKTVARTHFAPVARASPDDLQCDLRLLAQSPFVDGIMLATGGLLAILNDERQILAVNEAFVRHLGIDDVAKVFGLRPGEALNCAHAQDEAGGCGTSRFCASCGAVIAIMATLNTDAPQQRTCVAQIQKEGQVQDLCFLVHCAPIRVEHTRYLLFFLQDVTLSQNRAALENLFFHDIKNMIGALTLNTHLLSSLPGEQDRQASQLRIQQIASYLDKEVEMQRVLVHDDAQAYCLDITEITVAEVIQEVVDVATRHPAACGKRLDLVKPLSTAILCTDLSLLRRVLLNMFLNAFEATRPGQKIRLDVKEKKKAVLFQVWNELLIPESISLRIFQRNFSTKEGSGRGLGTYTMKLFGETYLGGKVRFTSSAQAGTTFTFELPLHRD